jgi:hypothetical protein
MTWGFSKSFRRFVKPPTVGDVMVMFRVELLIYQKVYPILITFIRMPCLDMLFTPGKTSLPPPSLWRPEKMPADFDVTTGIS